MKTDKGIWAALRDRTEPFVENPKFAPFLREVFKKRDPNRPLWLWRDGKWYKDGVEQKEDGA